MARGPMEIVFDNDAQQQLGVSTADIRRLICEALPDAQVKVYDLTGGGDHYQCEVTSALFEGKTSIARHRLVYGALSSLLSEGALHALALTTRTP